ncbi:MAG: RluA family pseudouridine synthase [Saprospiraceae bacterium]|nr:RluA family pseudouridine synthase [Saprospiraceae bacterium]
MSLLTTKKSTEVRISDMILHSDRQIIVLNKPAGMPSQEDRTGDPSMHRLAQAYCKHDLFVVHRLDRPCSGILLFAKTTTAAGALSEQWRDGKVTKRYLAVVPKGISPAEGTMTDHLEMAGGKVRIVPSGQGKLAVLNYRTAGEIDRYTLLDIDLVTGRTHQIRAQLSARGFPVKGDVRYGARRSNPWRGIHLHAYQLSLTHPTREETLTMTAPLPDEPVWKAFEFS